MKLLGTAWASPLTLAGLAHGVLLGGRPCGVRDGALDVLAPKRGPLAWFFRTFRVSAYTWGECVVYRDEACLHNERLRRHERAHVRQCRAWGPLIVPFYLGASLWAFARGRHPYRDNVFEVAARRAESSGAMTSPVRT